MSTSYRFLDFELDPVRFQLRRGDAEIPIPRQVFDLILLLIRHRDRPVTKAEILRAIWPDRTVTDASLTHAIAHARRALGDSSEAQAVIRTVHARGYWWVAETSQPAGTPATTPFVGREGDLARLNEELAEAAAGRGRLVLVLGAAGIGKTKLLQRFGELSEINDALVFTACAEDLDPTPPFYLWRQILSAVVAHAPKPPRRAVASLLGADDGDHGRRARDAETYLESRAARVELYDAIVSTLRDIASRRAVVVVMEDLHKADLSSLHALAFVTSRLDRGRVLFVGTQRPHLPDADEPRRSQLVELNRRASGSPVVLEPLSLVDIENFLRQLSDPRIPLAALQEVSSASGGNPFMLWQLVGLARLRSPATGASIRTPMPVTIRDVVVEHAKQTSVFDLEVVRVASVLALIRQ